MILADTSAWIDHLRRANRELAALLDDGRIVCHPFVEGELILGGLPDDIAALLSIIPLAPQATHPEALVFVERHRLTAAAIGWIDVHLLCSAALGDCRLWTRDGALRAAAGRIGLAYEP